MAVQIVINTDVDTTTTEVKNTKLNSNLIFDGVAVTVPTNEVSDLIFRKMRNSNNILCVTGFKYKDTWLGDTPKDGKYINPFTGEVITTEGYVEPEKIKLVLQENGDGITISFLNIPNEFTLPTVFHDTYVNGYDAGSIMWEETATTYKGVSATNYIYTVQDQRKRDNPFADLRFKTVDGEETKTRNIGLSRTFFDFASGFTTYQKEWDTLEEFKQFWEDIVEFEHPVIIDGD